MARNKKHWFLTRDDEDKVKALVTNLYTSSWRSGRDCHSSCPDYSHGFGVLHGLKEAGLIESHEVHEWSYECMSKAEREYKKENKK